MNQKPTHQNNNRTQPNQVPPLPAPLNQKGSGIGRKIFKTIANIMFFIFLAVLLIAAEINIGVNNLMISAIAWLFIIALGLPLLLLFFPALGFPLLWLLMLPFSITTWIQQRRYRNKRH